MRAVWGCLSVGFAVTIASSARADDPAIRVPAEGAWARYHGVTKPDDGPEVIYKSTIRVLHREQHSGRVCRWIEVDERDTDAGDGQALQYLIPETVLTDSARPLDEAVRAITRDHDGKILLDSPGGGCIGFNGTDLLFLSAARKGAKVVDEPQTVEYQTGKLVIPQGERGEYSWVRNNLTMTWEYTVWTAPKVSLGLARKKMKLTRKIDDVVNKTWTMDQYLEDFGFDAKSAFLP